MSKDYLFAYGTLREGFHLKLKDKIKDDLEYIGKAKLNGSLYDIGKYPGAVRKKEKSRICGDVFIVYHPERILKILDKYEGCLKEGKQNAEFVRRKNRVRLNSGKLINAWVYWYNRTLQGKTRIGYKDYFRYLQNAATA